MQPNTFSRWIKKLRAEQDLTQEMLSELVGCATPTLRSFEIGARRPSRDMAERIADVLKVPADQRAAFIRLARQPVETDLPESGEPAQPRKPSPAVTLPQVINPLIGREAEHNALQALLLDEHSRLVTITGAGGMGKTRLAVECATSFAPHYQDGAGFAPLAAIERGRQLPIAIAMALNITLQGAHDPSEQVLAALRGRTMLLVLDNLEHLLADADTLAWIKSLMLAAPAVQLLVTSRERLRITGERVFELSGLTLSSTYQAHAPADAHVLFLARAQQVESNFVLDADNHAAIARICRLVEGMPLGIELAAAWVRVLSCQEIADEIQRNLDFLALAERDVSPRHRSMRAIFDHSWKLLSEEEQRSLAQLSIFRGGCRREAAASVANTNLTILASLIDKSLVRKTQTPLGTRYEMHELLRQYAASHLGANAGQEQAARDRHSQHYLALLRTKRDELRDQRQNQALAELVADIDNLTIAWDHALLRHTFDQIGEAIWPVYRLYELHKLNTYEGEGESLFRRAAQAIEEFVAGAAHALTTAEQAKLAALLGELFSHQAYFSFRRGDSQRAVALYEASLAHLRPMGLSPSLGSTLQVYGSLQWMLGDFAYAQRLLDEALPPMLQANDQWLQVIRLVFVGALTYDRGDAEGAYQLLTDLLAQARTLGAPRLVAFVAGALGRIANGMGRSAAVTTTLAESLQLAHTSGDHSSITFVLEQLAAATFAGGDENKAQQLLNECIERYRAYGDQWSLARAYNLQGTMALQTKAFPVAQASFAQAHTIAKTTGFLPDHLEAVVGLATCAAHRGDPQRAEELARSVVDHPAATHATRLRATALLTQLPLVAARA